ncbi:sugar transferase [Aeromicrobium sp. CF4.19]|uniref:sugar transferase n=1 Tax=Aeromicrobium sp. CF4.19 TaxID=3373082 RepID=UPI003EE7F682
MYLSVRRFAEVILSGIALVLSAPLFAIIAVLVRTRMGQPVIFAHRRIGHRGPFTLYKFRTMVNGAEEAGGGYMPAGLDLVPPLGKALRRTSLDELPQLVNILRGDMSFVGPRPALPSQVERYTEEQRGRLKVPQGVTGLAQVRYRNDALWSVRIESDLEYVRRVGPVLDASLLWSTIVGVATARGVRLDQTAGEVDDLGRAERQDKEPPR